MSAKKVRLTNPAIIATIAEMRPVLREKTATKTAGRLIKIGQKAIASAMAERDDLRRRQMLSNLGFE